jgi:ABC-type phosphate transport system substrate-binding protein
MESSRNIHRNFKRVVLKLLAVACFFVLTTLQAHAQQTLAVIANQNGSPSALSFRELRSVFRGEKQRWGNGTKVMIALIKTNNTLGVTISQKIYDMKPDALNKYWLALVFQGRASAPYFFNTVPELQTFVSQNPGSIGIIEQPISTPEIKTVVIDGKRTL